MVSELLECNSQDSFWDAEDSVERTKGKSLWLVINLVSYNSVIEICFHSPEGF